MFFPVLVWHVNTFDENLKQVCIWQSSCVVCVCSWKRGLSKEEWKSTCDEPNGETTASCQQKLTTFCQVQQIRDRRRTTYTDDNMQDESFVLLTKREPRALIWYAPLVFLFFFNGFCICFCTDHILKSFPVYFRLAVENSRIFCSDEVYASVIVVPTYWLL